MQMIKPHGYARAIWQAEQTKHGQRRVIKQSKPKAKIKVHPMSDETLMSYLDVVACDAQQQ